MGSENCVEHSENQEQQGNQSQKAELGRLEETKLHYYIQTWLFMNQKRNALLPRVSFFSSLFIF